MRSTISDTEGPAVGDLDGPSDVWPSKITVGTVVVWCAVCAGAAEEDSAAVLSGVASRESWDSVHTVVIQCIGTPGAGAVTEVDADACVVAVSTCKGASDMGCSGSPTSQTPRPAQHVSC